MVLSVLQVASDGFGDFYAVDGCGHYTSCVSRAFTGGV
jgi:hypothetical protein